MTTIIKDEVTSSALEGVYVYPLLSAFASALDADLSRVVVEMERLPEEERLLAIFGAMEAEGLVTRIEDLGVVAFGPNEYSLKLMKLRDLTKREIRRAICRPCLLKLDVSVGRLNANAALIGKLSDLIALCSWSVRWRALGTVFVGLGKGHVVVKGAEGRELTLKITKAGEREGWGKSGGFLQFCLLRPGSLVRCYQLNPRRRRGR